MNKRIIQEFYDLVYEQAVEDTIEYLEENNEYNINKNNILEGLAGAAMGATAGAGLTHAAVVTRRKWLEEKIEKLKKELKEDPTKERRKRIGEILIDYEDQLDDVNRQSSGKRGMALYGLTGGVGALYGGMLGSAAKAARNMSGRRR